jgi:hypothetical protein
MMTAAIAAAPLYLVGLDLGQAQDFSAWIVAECIKPPGDDSRYDVRHIDHIRSARYPAIVDHITALVAALREPVAFVDRHVPDPRGYLRTEQRPICPTVHLVVNYTGVGRPVADMLLAAELDRTLTLVTITGGDAVTRGDNGEVRVPKRDLASPVQVLLQSDRLRIGQELPHARTLTDELVNFRV